jgi:hypothetical protein
MNKHRQTKNNNYKENTINWQSISSEKINKLEKQSNTNK